MTVMFDGPGYDPRANGARFQAIRKSLASRCLRGAASISYYEAPPVKSTVLGTDVTRYKCELRAQSEGSVRSGKLQKSQTAGTAVQNSFGLMWGTTNRPCERPPRRGRSQGRN